MPPFTQYKFRRQPTRNNKDSFQLDLSKIISASVPLLIFFSAARLILYYIRFNIYIIPFLDFSEILTQFFDLVVFIIITASGFILINFLFQDYIEYRKKNPLGPIQKVHQISKWNWKGIFYFIVGVMVIAFVTFITSYFGKEYTIAIIYYNLFMLIPFVYYFILEVHGKNINKGRKYLFLIAYGFIVTMLLIVIITYTDSSYVKSYFRFKGVKIKYKNNEVFISDSSDYYIGNTKNYLFIYNQNKNTTTVSKMDDVKEIEFPERVTEIVPITHPLPGHP